MTMIKNIAFALGILTFAVSVAGCTAEQASEPVEQSSDEADALTTSQLYGTWIADTGPIYRIEFTKNYAETLGGGMRGRSFNATVDNGIRCVRAPCPSSDEVAGVYQVGWFGTRLRLASYDRPTAVFAKYLGDYGISLVSGRLTLRKTDGTVRGTFHKAPAAGGEGAFCGGIAAFPCQPGLVCQLDGTYPDAGGKCVKAEGAFCGGIAAIECPSGYVCKLDGTYPDAGGKCVKGPTEGAFCGGIAAIECPKGLVCKLDGTYPDAGGKCVKP